MLVLFLLYNLVSLFCNCSIECLHHSKYILLFFLVFFIFCCFITMCFHFPTSISPSIHLHFSMFLFLFWLIMFQCLVVFIFKLFFWWIIGSFCFLASFYAWALHQYKIFKFLVQCKFGLLHLFTWTIFVYYLWWETNKFLLGISSSSLTYF